jgi:hypothetical protein
MRKFTSLLSALALAALLPGTAEADVDCTSLITNPGFETNNDVLVTGSKYVKAPEGWSIATRTFDDYDQTGTVTTQKNNGSYSFKLRDNWTNSSTTRLTQIINDLPSGTYTLTAYAYPNSTTQAKGSISVLAGTNALGTSASTTKANLWNTLSVDFTIPSGTTSITIEGIFNKIGTASNGGPEGFVYFDDFSLKYTGTETDLNTLLKTNLKNTLDNITFTQNQMSASVWTALQNAITAGNTEYSSTSSTTETIRTATHDLNVAIAAANVAVPLYNALKTAIDNANAYQTTPADETFQAAITTAQNTYDSHAENDVIQSATATLTEAIYAHLGLIKDVTSYITNPSFESGMNGWTQKDNHTDYISSYPSGATSTVTPTLGNNQLVIAPSGGHFYGVSIYQNITLPAGVYELSADAYPVSDIGGGKIPMLFAGTGTMGWYGLPATILSKDYVTAYGTWNSLALKFTLSESTTVTIGYFVPGLNKSGANYSNHYVDNYKLKTICYSRDVTSGNYGTICLPYSYSANQCTGISNFYTVSGKTTDAVQLTEATTLSAGVPYVFLSSSDKVTIPVIDATFVPAPVAGANGLTGTFTAIDKVAQGQYVLKNNYIYLVNSDVNVAANRAYFDLANCADTPAGVKAISINGGATGIQSVEKSNVDSNAVIYDMMGRRVTTPTHGVYIVNGKKIHK